MMGKHGLSALKAQYGKHFKKWSSLKEDKNDQDGPSLKDVKGKRRDDENEMGINDDIVMPRENLMKGIASDEFDAKFSDEPTAPSPEVPEEVHIHTPSASPAPHIPAANLQSAMQRDTDLTLGDIILDLKDYARSVLVENLNPIVPQETYNNLRFLKIPHLEKYSDIKSEVVCTLTEKGDYPTEKRYVAVSYCWESFSSSDSTGSTSFLESPTVLVKQGDKTPRVPKCPTKVLLRAIAFAIAMDISLIWIDQECVDQGDPADIEAHLQCNHKIYSQTEYAVGPLSFQLSKRQAECVVVVQLIQNLYGVDLNVDHLITGDGLKALLVNVQFATRLFKCIARDRWFTRAWVFQERFSAEMNMHLLLPLSKETIILLSGNTRIKILGEDMCVTVRTICTAAALLVTILKDQQQKLNGQDNAINDATYKILELFHEAAQGLSGSIFAGTSFNRICDTFSAKPNSLPIEHVSNLLLHKTFLDLESCDSRFVCDRLAILSNLMNFETRIPAISFNSYSLALLRLLSANARIPSVLVRTKTRTPKPRPGSRTVPTLVLILLVYQIKDYIEAGKFQLQKELENVLSAIKQFYERDVTQYTKIWSATSDAMRNGSANLSEEQLQLLSEIDVPGLICQDVIPLNATIEQLLGGIVAKDHIDNIGLDYHHGETVVALAIEMEQLAKGDTFIAFAGKYRWRAKFVEKFFVKKFFHPK